MSANLGTNICPRGKQALPGSAINRIIKQTVMSGIIANYDKICFGICLRGSRVLKSAQEFITAAGLNRHLSKHSVCVCVGEGHAARTQLVGVFAGVGCVCVCVWGAGGWRKQWGDNRSGTTEPEAQPQGQLSLSLGLSADPCR